MTDPSSQNPFDSAKEPEKDKPQQKLKLKQLLTPLSPHLKVEHKKEAESGIEDPDPMANIPRAVPMEPEPELAPHERPPSPDGSPIPPNQPVSAAGIEQSSGGLGMEQPVLPPMPQQDPVQEAVSEEPQQDAAEELVSASAPAPKPGRLKKVVLPVIGLLLILAGIHYYFDPLGLSIDPVAHEAPVVLTDLQQPAVEEEEMPESMASVNLSLELDKLTTESFMKQLEEQVIIFSENPKGAIIGEVFYPEGSTLNPKLGLVLSSVEGTGNDFSIKIVDMDGKEYVLQSN